MSIEEELQQRIVKLEADIAELRRELRNAYREPRLGPQPLSLEQEEAKKRNMQAIFDSAAAKMGLDTTDSPKMCTTNGKSVAEVRASQTNDTGQHDGYIVLCPDERAKGFVRPYRDRYEHVGSLQHLDDCPASICTCRHTVHEQSRCGFCECGVSAPSGLCSCPKSQACGTVTTMGRALSETYARDPKFYGSTFCCGCNRHFPVAEFVWTADGTVVGS